MTRRQAHLIIHDVVDGHDHIRGERAGLPEGVVGQQDSGGLVLIKVPPILISMSSGWAHTSKYFRFIDAKPFV